MSSDPRQTPFTGAVGMAPPGEVDLPSDLAIRVEGVSKRYDVYASAGARLKGAVARAMRRTEAAARCSREFWALRDVSFDVAKGEAVGIIGRNGSGKSTLMQIIAGTLTPTAGRVLVRGRVAALLELGSGFNREFTGRENVFLSGSILGIPRAEMEKRFDEIAAFADIGEFLDQPIHVYSSGMHARLAFAVSISVDPDVLILDEILSVGDAGFQQRCIGRLHSLLDRGVTLLFVSHNADAVKSICTTGLFLHHGRTVCIGPAERAVDEYLSHVRGGTTRSARKRNKALEQPVGFEKPVANTMRYGLGHAQIESVRLTDKDGHESDAFKLGETVVLEIVIAATIAMKKLDASFEVRDRAGVDLFGSSMKGSGKRLPRLKAGERVRARFAFKNVLRPGPHGICVTLKRRPDKRGEGLITLDHLDGCAAFTSLKLPGKKVRGKLRVPVKAAWSKIGEPGAEEAHAGGPAKPIVTRTAGQSHAAQAAE